MTDTQILAVAISASWAAVHWVYLRALRTRPRCPARMEGTLDHGQPVQCSKPRGHVSIHGHSSEWGDAFWTASDRGKQTVYFIENRPLSSKQ